MIKGNINKLFLFLNLNANKLPKPIPIRNVARIIAITYSVRNKIIPYKRVQAICNIMALAPMPAYAKRGETKTLDVNLVDISFHCVFRLIEKCTTNRHIDNNIPNNANNRSETAQPTTGNKNNGNNAPNTPPKVLTP